MQEMRVCEYLRVKPNPEGREIVDACIRALRKNSDIRKRKQYVELATMMGTDKERSFQPNCEKNDSFCVVMNSPVMAMARSGDAYDPFHYLLLFSRNIEYCGDRQIPEGTNNGKLPLDLFLEKYFETIE